MEAKAALGVLEDRKGNDVVCHSHITKILKTHTKIGTKCTEPFSGCTQKRHERDRVRTFSQSFLLQLERFQGEMNAVSVQKNGFDVTLNPRLCQGKNQLDLRKFVRVGGEVKVNGVVVSVERGETQDHTLSSMERRDHHFGYVVFERMREFQHFLFFMSLLCYSNFKNINVSLTRNQGSSAHRL